MYYGLVHFPKLKNRSLDRIRKKYDPWFGKICEHITFIFPVPDLVGLDSINAHIRNNLKGIQPFECHFTAFKKSWDHFLLWQPQEGNEMITELHDKLYTGILEPYYRRDIPFEPHIALGLFTKRSYDPENPSVQEFDEDLFQRALFEAQNSSLNVWIKIDKLTLLEFDSTFSWFKEVGEFILKK